MSSFGERLKELCQVEIPEAMHPILVRMLVITLKVLALATKRSKHPEDAQTRHHKRDRLVTLFKSNASQYLRQLFMGEDTEISAAIDALKKVVKEEHRMAATSTLKNTQVISKTTTSIMKSTDSINETTALTWKGYNELHQEFTQFSHVVLERLPEYASKEAKKRRDHSLGTSMKSDAAKGAEKSKRLKSILLPYAGYATVLGCLQRRVPTTTDGLMKETPVKDWLDRKIQVLHLVGGTGYGKTFAAGRIVDELQNRVKQQLGAEKASINTARMLTAYYFNTDENADVRKMLRTLAFQIASGNPAYFQHVDRVNKKETIRNLDVDRLWGVLFTEYFKETKSPAYLVLDGIDQLPVDEREQLLTCLGKKQAPGSTLAAGIQLMLVTGLSSRERLEALFGDSRAVIGPDIEHDFPTFVRTNLRTAWAKRFITNNLFSVTVKEIVAASRGNYLQASLIIDEVASLSREQDVRKAIDTLPKTLTEAAPLVFDRLKRQLGPEDQQDLTASTLNIRRRDFE
jgi:Cdc6-like AAA superfamily ATPase